MISGGDGSDYIDGVGGFDNILGGVGSDVIFGDIVDGFLCGLLNLIVMDNFRDFGVVEIVVICVVELVMFVNGDLIMIMFECMILIDGIVIWCVDNDL